MDHVAPSHGADAFNCPWCGAYSAMQWYQLTLKKGNQIQGDLTGGMAVRCERCRKFMIWNDQTMIRPSSGVAPLPSPDMPETVRQDYEEARAIVTMSPRGAAALLRLCVQKLCVELGQPGRNLNDDIASLVEFGLPPGVQKALDYVRVIGNNAVHPGQIDLDDNPDMAYSLFRLVNLIVEKMFTEPAELESLFDSLPQGARAQIAERDGVDGS